MTEVVFACPRFITVILSKSAAFREDAGQKKKSHRLELGGFPLPSHDDDGEGGDYARAPYCKVLIISGAHPG